MHSHKTRILSCSKPDKDILKVHKNHSDHIFPVSMEKVFDYFCGKILTEKTVKVNGVYERTFILGGCL